MFELCNKFGGNSVVFYLMKKANLNKSTYRHSRGLFMGAAMLNAVAFCLSYTKVRVVQPQSCVIDKDGFFLKFQSLFAN